MAAERPAPKYDQLLKRLFTHAHDEVIALLGLSVTWQGERSPEVPAKPRQADLGWEVVDAQDVHTLLHIELQVKIEPDISQRVAEYALRLYIKHKLPVHSVVIYLKPGSNIPPAQLAWDALGRPAMRYEYSAIRLWEVPLEQVSQTPHPWLWPLASLLAGATTDTAGETLNRLGAADLPQDDQRELEQTTLLLATLRFPWEAVTHNLRRSPMLDEILAESDYLRYMMDQAAQKAAQEAEARGLEQGKELGLEQGKELGMITGEMAGLREAVRTALIARFGALDATTEAAIASANRDACLAVLANFMKETLEQAQARLLAQPAKETPLDAEPKQE